MRSIRPQARPDGRVLSSQLDSAQTAADPAAKRREIIMFVLLAFVIWPFLAVAIVGGYGFLVWMTQVIMGPPGPPPV
jgi:nitrate reductase NapE